MLIFNSKLISISAIVLICYMLFNMFKEISQSSITPIQQKMLKRNVVHGTNSSNDIDVIENQQSQDSIMTIRVDPETMKVDSDGLTVTEKIIYFLFRDRIDETIKKAKKEHTSG